MRIRLHHIILYTMLLCGALGIVWLALSVSAADIGLGFSPSGYVVSYWHPAYVMLLDGMVWMLPVIGIVLAGVSEYSRNSILMLVTGFCWLLYAIFLMSIIDMSDEISGLFVVIPVVVFIFYMMRCGGVVVWSR